MRLRFLGTGTSFGVPVIGCDCAVCRSSEPRNRRSRHSLTLEKDGHVLLVDTPPELRLQLIRERINRIDAVFLTHLHADHVHGIDDLRIFSARSKQPIDMYVAKEYEGELRERFPYIFDDSIQPNPASSSPEIELRTFEEGEEIELGGFTLLPLAFPHGNVRSYGFRAGEVGVIVDAKAIPQAAREALNGIEILVINALWRGHPHPTHFNVEEALEAAQSLGARRAYLTHLTHRLEYEDLMAGLPEGVEPAYDGLVVEIDQA